MGRPLPRVALNVSEQCYGDKARPLGRMIGHAGSSRDMTQSLVQSASDKADLNFSDGRGTADFYGPASLPLYQFMEQYIDRAHLRWQS